MNTRGPLVVVEDDPDDQELLMLSFEQLGVGKDVRLFKSAETALHYLYETSENPSIIFSDINMPKMSGIVFKKIIDDSDVLKAKCIPFIFLSTSTSFIKDTCDLNIQGYFEKGNSLEYLSSTVRTILKYWDQTRHMKSN